LKLDWVLKDCKEVGWEKDIISLTLGVVITSFMFIFINHSKNQIQYTLKINIDKGCDSNPTIGVVVWYYFRPNLVWVIFKAF